MEYSLLAHLLPYIKGSQEDIATLSLQYLLSQSKKLNRAFTRRLADNMKLELPDTLQYSCQVAGMGDEKERPDMAGFNAQGSEEILCEMKFYASLTANQPLTYIRRLKDNSGKGLMFICPLTRRTSLWAKLQELCKDSNIEEVGDYCICVDGIHLAIITWVEIIDLLKQVAASADIAFTSDIVQLEGYCNKMDSDAFIPYSADDLSAVNAKREDRHYQVIDEVVELLLADKSRTTSKKGVKATAYRKGYTRSLYIDNLTVTINYDRELWEDPETVDTPFWFAIRTGNWEFTDEISAHFMNIPDQRKVEFWNMTFVAAEPLQNATLSEVCENIKKQICDLVDRVQHS